MNESLASSRGGEAVRKNSVTSKKPLIVMTKTSYNVIIKSSLEINTTERKNGLLTHNHVLYNRYR